jgi:hypothetical protein
MKRKYDSILKNLVAIISKFHWQHFMEDFFFQKFRMATMQYESFKVFFI